MRILPRIVVVILLTVAAFAQAPLTFEVASVKAVGPLDPQKIMKGEMRMGMRIDGAMVDIGSMSMSDMLQYAFGIKVFQLTGPSWMNGERYTVQARLPEGAKKEDVPQMMQALLAERFQLKYHKEEKEGSTYALLVGKSGPKLKEALPDEVLAAEAEAAAAAPQSGPQGGPRVMAFGGGGDGKISVSGSPEKGMVVRGGPNGPMKVSMGPGGMHMENAKMSMEQFAETLIRFTGRPVIDMTELKGFYQVAFDVSMEDMQNAASSVGAPVMMMKMHDGPGGPGGGSGGPGGGPMAETSGGGIMQSVAQLGLKLESRKSPIVRIVVDSVEKTPTEN